MCADQFYGGRAVDRLNYLKAALSQHLRDGEPQHVFILHDQQSA